MNKKVSGLRLLSLFLMAGGIGGLVYFFIFFDTSVAVPGGAEFGVSRVNNLGLMNDRQNGIIISAVILLIGVALAIAKMFKPDKVESKPRLEYHPLPVSEDHARQVLFSRKNIPPDKK